MEKNIKLKLNSNESNKPSNIEVFINGEKVKTFDSKDNKINSSDIFEIMKIKKNESINLIIEPENSKCDYFIVIGDLFMELTEKINNIV